MHSFWIDYVPAPVSRASADSFSMSFADPPAATMATFAAPAAGADCGGAMAGVVVLHP